MATVLGWDSQQRQQQVERYREVVAAMTAFAADKEQAAKELP
jgi:hypothetical protein